MLNDK